MSSPIRIQRIEAARFSWSDAIELADTALDSFRDDPFFQALNVRFDHPQYSLVRLLYAMRFAAKVWRRDVRTWIAVRHERIIALCRWEKLPETDNGVSRVWIWLAKAGEWLLDTIAAIYMAPRNRLVSTREMNKYFEGVTAYFNEVAPVPKGTAYLGLMCVRRNDRGKGIGYDLLGQSMKEIAEFSPPPPQLSLWSTAAGLQLYKKLGFTVRAEHSQNFKGSTQRQVFLTK